MELSFLFLVVLGILVFLFAFHIPKRSESRIPRPSGVWPIIGHLHMLRGKIPIPHTLGAIADKLGPAFSLQLGNRRAVVVSNQETVKECFTKNDKTFASRPNMAALKYMGYDYASFPVAPYGPYWREVRKMVTLTLFTNTQLDKLKHVRAREVKHNIKGLYLKCSKNVVMNTWFDDLTLYITTRMLVGKRLDNAEDIRFKEAVKRALYLSGVFVISDFIPYLEWLDIGGYVKSMKHTFQEMDQVISKWLEEHMQNRELRNDGDDDADFMDVMLSSLANDPITFSDHDHDTIIKSTTLALILTGSESMSNTLSWALSLLLNNPKAMKIVQDELDTNVGRNNWVEESDIRNLTYLQAVVKETLRLYPPAPLAGPREATEDCFISGHNIPKGTRLIMNVMKLQRDPKVWSNPNEFQPERFLKEHTHVNYSGQNFEYVPFSSGRRMCPATTYGLQVTHLIIASLLQGFDVSTPHGKPVDMTEGLGISMPKVEPLKVILTPRLPLQLYQ